MEIHKDDVLEHALTKGIASASQRFSLPGSEVMAIVNAFKDDIEDHHLCPCEAATKDGHASMCFMCEGRPERILI
ncbi:hypothetical protein [Spirosoma sp. KNUC1025]|uniref:hypothetical protein n=1 Tax=Spirosoma sp. KNUC1025 TaxID=2894082 RepID=UPI003864A33C|nr:hypothetical protein LN737_19150 [Spirosoma sp. KNUC1025]